MPNHKSAEKRMRQQTKRQARNRAQRSRLRTSIKKVMLATTAEEATVAYRESAAMLDRFATRRLIHRNKAARKKSQLAHKVIELGGQP